MIQIAISTFILATLLLLVLKPLAFRVNLLDKPGGRKKHFAPVPLVGGLGIFLSVILSSLFFLPITKSSIAFGVAAFILITVGAIDDKFSISPKIRILAQFVSAVSIIFFGNTLIMRLGNLFGFGDIFLPYAIGVAFSCIAVVGIINAVNMMDGIDGLTASVSLVELCLLLGLSFHAGANSKTTFIIFFISSILAFLIFNFPSNKLISKRRIFLGDAGSTFIGITLCWLCIRLTQIDAVYPPVIMLWIIALPLMDATRLIINRLLRGYSPLKGDRRHIHHILLQLGYSSLQAVSIISLLSLLIGLLGIALHFYEVRDYILFYSFLAIFCGYATALRFLKKLIVKRKLGLNNERFKPLKLRKNI